MNPRHLIALLLVLFLTPALCADDTEVKKDVPYVPTPQEVVDKMLELAQIKNTDTVYDLGCGDGRIVVTAAQRFGCRAVGYDIDPDCVRLSI